MLRALRLATVRRQHPSSGIDSRTPVLVPGGVEVSPTPGGGHPQTVTLPSLGPAPDDLRPGRRVASERHMLCSTRSVRHRSLPLRLPLQ